MHSIGVDVSPLAPAISVIEKVADSMRAHDVPVIWLNWGNRPDLANLPPNVIHVYDSDGSGGGIGDPAGRSPAVLTAGSWGAAIVDDLTPHDDDIRVDKYRMSGFWDTPLDSVLRAHSVDTVLFAGVNVDQCVLATLIDASCIGYDSVLLEDASATTSPEYCIDATLYNVRQCFGFTAKATDLVAALPYERKDR